MVEVLRLQAGLARQDGFFLAGGTGLALRLRHRFSDDLDWFTPGKFDAKDLIAKLKTLPRAPSSVELGGQYTVRAYYDKVETSFIMYAQIPARPEAMKVGGTTIAIADVGLQAAMKAAAIPGWSLAHFIDHAARQLPLAPNRSPAPSPISSTPRRSPCNAAAKCPGRRLRRISPTAFESGTLSGRAASICSPSSEAAG